MLLLSRALCLQQRFSACERSECWQQAAGDRVDSLALRGLGFRLRGSVQRFRVLGFRVYGSGFRVECFSVVLVKKARVEQFEVE